LLTECPECRTLFRIHPQQMRIARGKVRCANCNHVFNAVVNLKDLGKATPQSPSPEPLHKKQPAPQPTPVVDDDDLTALSRLFEEAQAAADDAQTGQEANATQEEETEQETPASGELPSFLDDLDLNAGFEPDLKLKVGPDEPLTVDLDEGPTRTTNRAAALDDTGIDIDFSPATDAEPITAPPGEPTFSAGSPGDDDRITAATMRLEDDICYPPPQRPSPGKQRTGQSRHPSSNRLTLPPPRKGHPLLWSLAILSLLLLATGQIAWMKQERLLQFAQVRAAAEYICNLTGCTIPPRRAPEKIAVVERTITSHPMVPGALLVRLTFVNRASFPQPYPELQLSLFDRNEALTARRRFSPDEYLGRPADELLQPGQSVRVEMPLLDPGKNVTGFKFDFF